MKLSELIKHPVVVAIISLLAGTALASLVYKIRSRMLKIHYFTNSTRIGFSQDDPVFGSIRVTWNQQPARNLHVITINFENISGNDIANLHLKAFVDADTTLLGERSGIMETSFIVPWSDEFKQSINVTEGSVPTPAQQFIFLHNREYHLPSLNRYQKGQITFLCTRQTDDNIPRVYLETTTKGVFVRKVPNPMFTSGLLWGVPIAKAAVHGIAIWIIALLLCGYFVSNRWIAIIIPAIAGLAASLFGAIEYKIVHAIKRRITN